MSVEFNSPYTVFIDEAERRVTVLDQRLLPHRVEYVDLKNAQEAAEADPRYDGSRSPFDRRDGRSRNGFGCR